MQYKCPQCGHVSTEAGNCPMCNVPMQPVSGEASGPAPTVPSEPAPTTPVEPAAPAAPPEKPPAPAGPPPPAA